MLFRSEEAGYVHTARSRNDQVITDFKIWMKNSTNEINDNINKVIKSTIKLAEKNVETIMPGFTHLKNAQAISFAHYLMSYVEMLFKQKIISFRIKNKIIYGLQKIETEISKNKFEFDFKYEDIHMNIEKRLFQIIGEEAGYIHTARSRNDQVITDFKIWIKNSTNEINNNINKVIKSTIKLAEKNVETIMPGFTHLKNAQAISFAHY